MKSKLGRTVDPKHVSKQRTSSDRIQFHRHQDLHQHQLNVGKTPAIHQMKERSEAQTNASIHHDPRYQHSSPSTRR